MNSTTAPEHANPALSTRQTLRTAVPTLLYVFFGRVWIVASDLVLLSD